MLKMSSILDRKHKTRQSWRKSRKFQKMCNIIAVAGRYHIFIKITRKTVFCHILQRAFRNGFIFNTIMFHQVRQILNQALICSLRAIIYQYLKRLIGMLCYWRAIEPDNTYASDSIAALKRLEKGY